MAVFPKIQSPCPYRANLAAVMDGDMCRLCKRQVVDISAMGDQARMDFLAGCKTEVCISYTAPALIAAAAMAVAASAIPVAAAAQDTVPQEEWLVVGGMTKPDKAEYVRDDRDTPPLPVVYEDDGAAQPAAEPAKK